MVETGRLLIFVGTIIILLGLLLSVFPKIPFIGKLPGDIYIQKDNFVFFFPITTSIILSLIISLILKILGR